jgi:hypothetical protein
VAETPNPASALRRHLQDIIDDMRARAYPPAYFMRAVEADDDELLERSRALLPAPQGQTAAFEYRQNHPDGITLEDIVIAHSVQSGFDMEDVDIARRTLQ